MLDLKVFLNKHKKTDPVEILNQESSNTQETGLISSPISKTPRNLRFAQIKSPFEPYSSKEKLSSKLEDNREKKIQKYLSNRIMNIKKKQEAKKNKQIEKLKQIETEREMQRLKVIEKIEKNSSSFIEKNSKSYDQFLRKSEKIKEYQEKNEKMHEEYIKTSLDKYFEREQKIKEKVNEELVMKSLKAKSMSRNLIDDRKWLEDEKFENDFINFLKKLKKSQQKRKEIEENIKVQIVKKQSKEKEKEKEVQKKLIQLEKEFLRKSKETEKYVYEHMEKKIQEKLEKQKNKIIQNELEMLSAKTRISRINSKFVIVIQGSYKSKLIENHIKMVKKIDEFKETRKSSSKLT